MVDRVLSQNLITWNKVVIHQDKSMHVTDFFADKIGADTSKVSRQATVQRSIMTEDSGHGATHEDLIFRRPFA